MVELEMALDGALQRSTMASVENGFAEQVLTLGT
jgi:hypothetical protein